MVGRFEAVGIDEFVLYWPGSWRPDVAHHEQEVFQHVAGEVIPALRGDSQGVLNDALVT
jgi:hypothetical protein